MIYVVTYCNTLYKLQCFYYPKNIELVIRLPKLCNSFLHILLQLRIQV